MYTVYILKSTIRERLYIGCTKNLEERIIYHNRGGALSTKAYKPWVLLGSEEFSTLAEARKRERYLKALKNPEYVIKIIMDS
jgi:putative endonuclease